MSEIKGNYNRPNVSERNYDLVQNGKLELAKNHKMNVINFNKMDKTQDCRIDENEFYTTINEQLKDANDKTTKMQKAMDDFHKSVCADKSLNIDEYKKMMDDSRLPVDGKFDKNKFVTIDKSGHKSVNEYKLIKYVTDNYDHDKDGMLSIKEARQFLLDTGITINKNSMIISYLMNENDKRKISLECFVKDHIDKDSIIATPTGKN